MTFGHPLRHSPRMSEIENVGQTWMAKSSQLTSLPFKGLKLEILIIMKTSL